MGINFLAVIVAVIAAFVVGAIWYSPAMFGKTWTRLTGMNMGGDKQGVKEAYMINIFGTVVVAIVLAVLFNYANIDTPTKAISSIILIWIGILMPFTLNDVAFAKKSKQLWLLNGAHQLVTLLVMGYIIAIWK